MQNITKKEFIETITNNTTHMCGLSHKAITFTNIIVNEFSNIKSRVKADGVGRTAKANGYRIKFNNDSILELNNNKYTTVDCYKVVVDDIVVLIVKSSYYNEYDGETTTKYLYYLIID